MKDKRPFSKAKRKSRREVAAIQARKASAPVPEELVQAVAPGALFWLMAGLSGFACLIYQILWVRQAGLLLMKTSQAAALTLAVFSKTTRWAAGNGASAILAGGNPHDPRNDHAGLRGL